ncbi:MAG: glycosyltransferase [Armatimonadetes bacterium]|nr:glycosyltransferase [Armatimonadota bacterium]
MQPITAVIPNRDGADLLRATLPPLLAELPPPNHQVLVVDDASKDDSVAMLARDFPSVCVVALNENVGFGAACNQGFADAVHDVVLLLNSDMAVTPGSISLLLEHFQDPSTFAAGPIYLGDTEKLENLGVRGGQVRPQIGAPAGGGLFRRDLYLDLGGFDALYHPFYWEDLDLGWNAWRAGLRIVYDTRCHFLHMESRTIKRLYSAAYVRRIRARNRVLFGWKNFDTPELLRAHTGAVARHILGDLLRRRDPASLLGYLDARTMRAAALASRPKDPPKRTSAEILAASQTDLARLLRI